MGKMKEEYMKEQEQIREAVEAFMDDDWQYESYLEMQARLKSEKEDCDCNKDCPCKGEPITQEESQENHDAWWSSLTDEQKQQLYNDKEEVDDISIEEMNHDLNFGK